MSRNVTPGLYRNSLGAELHVIGYVAQRIGVEIGSIETLGGDIAYAESRHLLGTTPYLVTEHSLRDCGYELIEESKD